MLQWLTNLPWNASSGYQVGQQIATLGTFLKLLPEPRKTEYLQTVWTFLERNQNQTTGYWGRSGYHYDGLSNVMKINQGVYLPYGKAIPRMEKIFDSMITTMQQQTPGSFMVVRNAIENMSNFINNSSISAETKASMMARFPDALRISTKILRGYKRPDGGFSYKPSRATSTSLGATIGEGLAEGDLIGTVGVARCKQRARHPRDPGCGEWMSPTSCPPGSLG